MKLPQIVQDDPIKIDRLVPGGQGIGTNKEGIKGFFWNALPGETVLEYEITKKKSHYFEATALKIENPSAHRISPKDSCYLSTSPWQIMSYSYELEQKSLLLEEIFTQHHIQQIGDPRRAGAGDTHGAPRSGAWGLGSPSDDSWGNAGQDPRHPCGTSQFAAISDNKDLFYRNKMEYSLYYDFDDQKLHLAFRKRGSHRKIKVETSSLERPEIFKRATEIVNELNKKRADGRNFQSLLLRCNQNGEVEGGLYENHQPHPTFPNLTDTILGKPYSYSPNGFFQINLPVYELALTEIKKHVKTENVLDLYAGVGTIGLSVADDKNLTLVEVDKNAYAELKNNAKDHQTILEKSENVGNLIAGDQTVIVDPPRAGLDPKLVEKLLETTPETIIYLSCNPATQARDIKLLLAKYQIEKVQPFNFFPRTPHLENLVVLNRK